MQLPGTAGPVSPARAGARARVAQACGVPRAPSPDPLRGQPPATGAPPGAACALPLCTCAVTAPNPGRTPGGPGRCGLTVSRPLGPFPLQTPSLPPSATASSLCPSVFTFPTCVLPRATALFRSAPAFEKRRPFPWTCPLYQWSPLCPFATRHFVPPPRSLAPRATPRRLGRRPRATSQLRAPRPRDPEFTAAFDARRIQTCSPRARSPPLMAAPHL